MEISQQVVLDLLPLYVAGEASEDSRKLVESYLDEHEEMAATVDSLNRVRLPEADFATASEQLERQTFERVRGMLKWRNGFFAAAIFFSAAIFSVWNVGDGVEWLLLEEPGFAALLGLVASLCWGRYFFLGRRLAGFEK